MVTMIKLSTFAHEASEKHEATADSAYIVSLSNSCSWIVFEENSVCFMSHQRRCNKLHLLLSHVYWYVQQLYLTHRASMLDGNSCWNLYPFQPCKALSNPEKVSSHYQNALFYEFSQWYLIICSDLLFVYFYFWNKWWHFLQFLEIMIHWNLSKVCLKIPTTWIIFLQIHT